MKALKKVKLKTNHLILIYSFTIPMLTVLLSFAFKELAPFGGRSIISMDGFSQYYPMLMNMTEAIRNGELFYSFSGALGFNLWAQNAYYTNSPLWLLVYLVPHSFQAVAIDLLVILKFALSGLFFSLYLIKTGKEKNSNKRFFLYTALSVSYALSQYMLAFINQLMWTDVIMLLPLVILGLEKLWEKDRIVLYVITLFLSIWSCFYIGYMVCLFLCLYFLYLAFREKHTLTHIIKKGVLFTFSSLVAGGIAAVVLLPTVKALSLTMASDLGFTDGIQVKYTLFELLRQFLPFQKISLEYGAPNLYCSVFALVLMTVFFFLKKVAKRERLVSFLFFFFMLISMSINLGEFVWHGFHFPNQLPARQSFLLIFLILSLASKGGEGLKLKKDSLFSAVSVVAIAGVSISFFTVFQGNTWASRLDSLQRYESSFETVKKSIADDGFYRMEWTGEKKNNLPQQCTYNGICYYSSTMTADAYKFFENLGMERYALRVSTHYTGTQMTDDLFGIKYILKEKLIYENENERLSVKVNEDALPLGYLSEGDVISLDLEEYEKGKEAQKALFNSIVSGGSENYDEAISYLHRNGFNLTEFDTDDIKGTVKAEKDGVMLFSIPYDEGWSVTLDGESVATQKAAGYLLCFEISEGEHEVELSYTVPGIKEGAIISIFSMLIFVVLVLYEKKKRK
ncbi:MAG: YfhO family protein [Clostridia bacterium]|nr:YfhO family protein [Clostridia bacterium]